MRPCGTVSAHCSVRLLYSALFYALLPFILARLAWRSRKLPAYWERWRERFAVYDTPSERNTVWFHAVSVGEAEAAFPLIRRFGTSHPFLPVLVTCTTPTGSARIKAVLGDSVRHVYLPYDLPDGVARFLNHFQPQAAVFLETEIWPNLYVQCQRRGIPLAIVNGRLSEKSARGYRKLRHLTAKSLAAVSRVAAQTVADAERYVSLGVASDRVTVTGNVKFDLEFSDAMRQQAESLRAELFGSRPIWIAGSTHPGEEEQILVALGKLKSAIPEVLLLLAPRHPERADEVQALAERFGFSVQRRTEHRPCAPATGVFLVDTLGELRIFYGMADVAFVGGSLIPRGGHNVLEPAAAGRPVLFGPYMFNFAEIAQGLQESGGGIEVTDGETLACWILRLLSKPDRRAEIGVKGQGFVSANHGAVERVMALLDTLLPPEPPTSIS